MKTINSIAVIFLMVQLQSCFNYKHAIKEGFDKVPETAKGPKVNALTKGFATEKIQEGVYVIFDGIFQCLAIDYGEGLILIDAPKLMGKKLLKAIKNLSNKQVTHLIYSHGHADHIGSAHYFKNAEIIAHQLTYNKLKLANDSLRPIPTKTFTGSKLSLNIGNRKLELYYFGLNHEPGNIFIYMPTEKILMAIDIVFPGWSPFYEFALAEDIEGYRKAHEELLNFDFNVIITGHQTRWGDRNDVMIQKEFVDEIFTRAFDAVQKNSVMDFLNHNDIIDYSKAIKLYCQQIARQNFKPLYEKWHEKLGGMDIYGITHLEKAIEYFTNKSPALKSYWKNIPYKIKKINNHFYQISKRNKSLYVYETVNGFTVVDLPLEFESDISNILKDLNASKKLIHIILTQYRDSEFQNFTKSKGIEITANFTNT